MEVGDNSKGAVASPYQTCSGCLFENLNRSRVIRAFLYVISGA